MKNSFRVGCNMNSNGFNTKNENSLLLSESDLEKVSLGRHSTYLPSDCRDSINRSRSIFLLENDYSSTKQKTIVTSLFCTSC
jgi:hypothetical protein